MNTYGQLLQGLQSFGSFFNGGNTTQNMGSGTPQGANTVPATGNQGWLSLQGSGQQQNMNLPSLVDPSLGSVNPELMKSVSGVNAPSATGFGFNAGTIQGIGSTMQGIGAGIGAWGALEQADIAKEALAFQKETFAKNWANQVAMTNTRLRDRQAARASASSFAQDVDSYMKENAVK